MIEIYTSTLTRTNTTIGVACEYTWYTDRHIQSTGISLFIATARRTAKEPLALYTLVITYQHSEHFQLSPSQHTPDVNRADGPCTAYTVRRAPGGHTRDHSLSNTKTRTARHTLLTYYDLRTNRLFLWPGSSAPNPKAPRHTRPHHHMATGVSRLRLCPNLASRPACLSQLSQLSDACYSTAPPRGEGGIRS